MAVFLLVGLIGLGSLSFGADSRKDGVGVLGGPASSQENIGFLDEAAVLSGRPIFLAQAGIAPSVQGYDFQTSDTIEGSVQDLGQPVGPASYRPDLFIYKVAKGDTISRVAANFGVSVETIVDANPKVKTSSLRAGDELVVLPVSGFVYRTKDEETLESVAEIFNIREERIREANPSVNFGVLQPDTALVIPGAKRADYAYASGAPLSDLGAYFITPAEGFNWGRIHTHNAIDIANTCGTTVRAAAEGLVIPDEVFGDGVTGWNGGYGHFVLIEHPLGDKVRTRYAHLDTVAVEIGNYVKQGQEIGTMGQTGEATGCHLHFEAYGAKNPFAKQ